jgi:hypothetical protein
VKNRLSERRILDGGSLMRRKEENLTMLNDFEYQSWSDEKEER